MYDFFLFESSHDDLHSAIHNMEEEDIPNFCGSSIYYRGFDYYDSGAVKEAFYSDKVCLKSIVRGSRDYEVEIGLDRGSVVASCSCPFDGVCKHVVAVLLYACNEEIEVGNSEPQLTDEELRKHLNELSKKEIIDLVGQFATEEFRTKIRNKYATKDRSAELVEKVSRKVAQLFDDEELLWTPGDMEGALSQQLSKLAGLGNKQSDEVFQLIIDVIKRINKAQDEGYLYDSYYDDVFDDREIIAFVRNFIRPLPAHQKVTYLNELDPFIRDSSYSTFEAALTDIHELFHKDELNELRNSVISNLKKEDYRNIEGYYQAIEPILSPDNKSFILDRVHHLSASLCLHLARIHEDGGNIKMAIRAIENGRKKRDYWVHKKTVLTELLRLKDLAGTLEHSFAGEVLSEVSDRAMLRKVSGYIPEKKQDFEQLLRSENIAELLEYFEEEGRLDEALTVVLDQNSIWEERKYSFFKRHKKTFPGQARAFFLERISTNLEFTGDKYYYKIADTLKSLGAVDSMKAQEVRKMIRANYKRRRNLMKLL